jgi:cation/acetate symporter
MNVAFFFAWFGSVTDRSQQARRERDSFDAQFIRAQTGAGTAVATAAAAAGHHDLASAAFTEG